MQSKEHSQLKEMLDKSYNLSDLQTICFDLYIDYEKLTGDEKSGKINALITYAAEAG